MPSSAASIHSLTAALRKAAAYARVPENWRPAGPQQQALVGILPHHADGAGLPEIDSIATPIHGDLVQWFAQRGWNMNISPYNPPDFGVGAILDVLSLWVHPGEAKQKIWDGRVYDVVSMRRTSPQERCEFAFHRLPPDQQPHISQRGNTPENLAVSLPTRNPGETICMAMWRGSAPTSIFDLYNTVQNLRIGMDRNQLPTPTGRVLTFPMVDLAVDTDISWLCQMQIPQRSPVTGGPVIIGEAKQKNRLRMNHTGAHAESATALLLLGGMAPAPPTHLVIDHPFLFWIERQNVAQPLFYAYVDRSEWKNPGSLG